MRHWLSKHLKGKERGEDDVEDQTEEGWAGLIVRTQTVEWGAEPERGATSRDTIEDRTGRDTRADLLKERTWRSRMKNLQQGEQAALRQSPVVESDGDPRKRLMKSPSFARSRYVLTDTGAWARITPPVQRRLARGTSIARQRTGERDACPPGLFLVRYLNPAAANQLAGDMRLVDGRWVENEQEGEVLDLGDEEELLKWAEDGVYWQPLPKEFDVDEEQLQHWRKQEREHREALDVWITEQDPQYVRRFKEDGLRQLWVVRVVDRANRPPRVARVTYEDEEIKSSRPSAIVQHQGILSFAGADETEEEEADEEDDDVEDWDDFEEGLEIPEEFGLTDQNREERTGVNAALATVVVETTPSLGSTGLSLSKLAGGMGARLTRQMVDDSVHQHQKTKDDQLTEEEGDSDSDERHGLPAALGWLIGTLRWVMREEGAVSNPLVLETFLEDPRRSSEDDSWSDE